VHRDGRTAARGRRAAIFAAAATTCLLASLLWSPTASATAAVPGDWLGALNYYRAGAGLGPVVEDPALSSAAFSHARYMVCTGVIAHGEDPTNPSYPPQGAAAASRSNLAAGSAGRSGGAWIEQWMAAPFHALHMLDPRLERVGFALSEVGPGDPCAGRSPWNAAAAIDVISGVSSTIPLRPMLFPGQDSAVRLDRFTGETPDPRLPCPGGPDAWQGLPMLAIFGGQPDHPNAWFEGPTGPQEVCVVTAATYDHPDPTWAATARSILGSYHAVVIIPRNPLPPGVHHLGVISDPAAHEAMGSWFRVDP
jgi:hypothetical protein